EVVRGGDAPPRASPTRPDLTADRFVPHPTRPGARAYRTGDTVRQHHDGTYTYLGRTDQQVKVRGFRIEPGDVEAALRTHPDIAEAVVQAVGEGTQRRLAAWLVPHGKHPDSTAVRTHLKTLLPWYLLPDLYTAIDQLPLTTSGKVDRKALPAPVAAPVDDAVAYEPPATAAESLLAEAWQEVLNGEPVGRADDFFALGGNSMLAARMMRLVRDRLDRDVPLLLAFSHPTLAGLAAALAGEVTVAEADLAGDAQLPPDIEVATAPDPVATPPREVLVTGATGFLGVHLLHQLLLQTDALVHCLVRAGDTEGANGRVRQGLVEAGLWQDGFAARIAALPGGLDRPRLGLDAAAYDRLATRLDAVYHNGATVNFLASYGQLRAPNVEGTTALLRLATERGRAVPVHFTSTIGVLPEGVTAEAPPTAEHGHLDRGYEQTKWVAERLVTAAGARGLPVSVYRPGRIGGDTTNGVGPKDDLVWQLVRLCAELGAAPDAELPFHIAPVDYVAAALVRLSLAPARGEVFHLVGHEPVTSTRILDRVRAAGHRVDAVDATAWVERARAHPAGEALLATLGPGQFAAAGASDQDPGPRFDDRRTRERLEGTGHDCPRVDDGMIDRWIRHYLDTGYLPPAPSPSPAAPPSPTATPSPTSTAASPSPEADGQHR
ncbi:thioester reductase domain protein, partial [Actinobacteria bacterium OK074]